MSQLVLEQDERQAVEEHLRPEPELTFKYHFSSDEQPEMVKHDPVKQLTYLSESDQTPHYAVEIKNPAFPGKKDPYNISLYRSDYKTSTGYEIPFVKMAVITAPDGAINDVHNIGPMEINYSVPGEKDTFITLQYRKNGTNRTVVLDQVVKKKYNRGQFIEVQGVAHRPDDPLYKQGRYLSQSLDYIDWKSTAKQYLCGYHEVDNKRIPCRAETLHEMPVVAAHTSILWR